MVHHFPGSRKSPIQIKVDESSRIIGQPRNCKIKLSFQSSPTWGLDEDEDFVDLLVRVDEVKIRDYSFEEIQVDFEAKEVDSERKVIVRSSYLVEEEAQKARTYKGKVIVIRNGEITQDAPPVIVYKRFPAIRHK